ncbi:hypothetical protein ACETIH_16785 [Microvirga arabica]|uniref:DUF2946 domain-containing protein n=1 Tax=Microvirga arabica TaxID=1128671 RepID=A0ABV6YAP8_9HYPH
MKAVWTHLRRYVTGLVLVAMASFVLHGGVLAGLGGHDAGHTRTEAHASHTKTADQPHQDCAGGFVVEAPDGCAPGADGGADGPHSLHCGSVCGLVLPTAAGPAAVLAADTVPLSLESQLGSGIDPTGLKRPPRTPGIA